MKALRKTLRITRNILLILLVLVVFIVSVLLIYRGIKRSAIRKEFEISTTNGIDEEEIVNVGEIDQYLYIRGEDVNNPVILFLHGGPGSPITPLIHTYQKGLEEHYTVVNWDQRNTGKTYFLSDPNETYETLTINRMVEDVKEISEYLIDRFSQEKIIIMGHSWGTVIGTLFAKKYPEYVKAYIGTGQVINGNEGDELAFRKALEKAKEGGNHNDVNIMENLDGYLLGDDNFLIKNFITARELSAKYLSPGLEDNTLLNLFISPYYSLKDLTFFMKNSFELQKPLMDELIQDYDTRDLGNVYEVPVFYIGGDKDWVTPTVMAKDFFNTIEAPTKDFVTIENAGHMTMIDQPELYCEAVIRILENL